MSLIECSAFFAAINPKILTESRCPWRRRPPLFQDVALLGQDQILAPQPTQLLALIRGQTLRVTRVDVDLTRPITQRLLRAAQLTRQLRDRPATGTQQPDRLSAELLRIRRRLWHRQTSSPPGQIAQPSDVHETGGSPVVERFLVGRGERVLRIPTHVSAGARKSARERGKSDPIDGIGVARVALRECLASFPVAQWMGPSSICGCWSITANGSFVSASA
jgi:hypothetical protein